MSLTLTQAPGSSRRAWTIDELATLTPQELALAIALKQYQGIAIPTALPAPTPPAVSLESVQVLRPAVRPKRGEIQLPDALARVKKECPKCHEVKQADRGFGPRLTASGKVVIQSYCRECRAKPNRVLPKK